MKNMERTITPETIKAWREALKDETARKRIRSRLLLHQSQQVLSPDLPILAHIYSSSSPVAPSLEFREKMIKQLGEDGEND